MEGQNVTKETEFFAREKDFNWCDTTPSQEYLHRWLREKHRMFISFEPYKTNADSVFWFSQVISLSSYDLAFKQFNPMTVQYMNAKYEDAYEIALKAALELITTP